MLARRAFYPSKLPGDNFHPNHHAIPMIAGPQRAHSAHSGLEMILPMAGSGCLDEGLGETSVGKPEGPGPVGPCRRFVVSFMQVHRKNERRVLIEITADPIHKGTKGGRVGVAELEPVPSLCSFAPVESNAADEIRVVQTTYRERSSVSPNLGYLYATPPLSVSWDSPLRLRTASDPDRIDLRGGQGNISTPI